ncbi:substrate-binding domain-containing protein [Scytonema sp. NUACC21]
MVAIPLICTFFGALSGCTTDNSIRYSHKLSANSPTQQEIRIVGDASTYLAMNILADAYISQVKNAQVSFVPANQSMAILAGVKNDLFDIGSVSEQLTLKDRTLEYREVAKDAILVATHSSVEGITNLTTDNLKAIYTGTLKNWKEMGGPDAEIIVLDLPEEESAKRLLRSYYLGEDLKNSKTAILLREENDAIAAVQNVPYSIGAFSSGYATSKRLSANNLSLNGVAATPDNVQTGKYPMVRTIGIISKKSSYLKVKGFLAFVRSRQAAAVLCNSGFLPPSH